MMVAKLVVMLNLLPMAAQKNKQIIGLIGHGIIIMMIMMRKMKKRLKRHV